MIQKLANQFASKLAGSHFGLANAIRKGTLHYERGRLVLRNVPPFDFYTCSTTTRLLIEHLRENGVPEQELLAADLRIPVAGKGRIKTFALEHLVPIYKPGRGATFFQLTPLDNLLANDLPVFVQHHTIDILQGQRIARHIDDPASQEIIINTARPGEYQFASQMLSASLNNGLLTTSYLGLSTGLGQELLVAYVADCLKRQGSDICLTHVGELGFIIGLDRDTAQRIGFSLAGNAGDYASFLPWIAATHDRSAIFLQQRYCAANHPKAASYMQQMLTDNLPVFGRFISILPEAVFG